MSSLYHLMLERLFALKTGHGFKPNTQRAEALDQALGHPSRAYPTIHIAGSNGKGSVAGKIARGLHVSGLRVGLYTSPHLNDYRERIAVGGAYIEEEEVVAGLERLFQLAQERGIDATAFELTTALALEYFRAQHVAVAVIETGIGGRFDATHVIEPILAVITSISKEHTALLGEDLEAIAYEKAGIIKKGATVILGPNARYASLYAQAEREGCPVRVVREMSPTFDAENSALARLALEQLQAHFPLSEKSIEQALVYRPSCRFERVGMLLFDVAHNPSATFRLLQTLHTCFPDQHYRFLVGYCRDKDYAACLDLIADVATHIHLVPIDSERAAHPTELQASLSQENPQLTTAHATIEEGAHQAHQLALSQGELLVICGSFYLMRRAKEALVLQEKACRSSCIYDPQGLVEGSADLLDGVGAVGSSKHLL